MGGITSTFNLTVGAGLSGAGSVASPLVNTGVTSFIGQTGSVDPTVYGSIGSYVLAGINGISQNTGTGPNNTYAGSALYRSADSSGDYGANGVNKAVGLNAPPPGAVAPTNLGLSGTWRQVTRSFNSNYSDSLYLMGLFVRIS